MRLRWSGLWNELGCRVLEEESTSCQKVGEAFLDVGSGYIPPTQGAGREQMQEEVLNQRPIQKRPDERQATMSTE